MPVPHTGPESNLPDLPYHDPEASAPPHFGPPMSETNSMGDTEPQAEEDAQTAPADPEFVMSEVEPLPSFDERYRTPMEGLLFLGALSKIFHWCGHSFKIRTITHGELIEASTLSHPYIGTLAELRSYQAAIVAACCVEVDGRPISIPITNEPSDTLLANRFEYINNNWFAPVIDVIYDQYLKLEIQASDVLNAMDAASPFQEAA